MPRLSRADALEDIASWATADVVALLQKNGLEEACWKAAAKRQIDGDELLHLTEGKLALWKSDLTRPLIWSLWTFVEEVKKCPENYVEEKLSQQQQEQPLTQLDTEELSDTGSWDTDFEDGVEEAASDCNATTEQRSSTMTENLDFRNSLRLFQENDRLKMEAEGRGSSYSLNKVNGGPTPESTYANCEAASASDLDSTYANVGYAEAAMPCDAEPAKNTSKLHSPGGGEQKSLAEKLKEQLMLMGAKPAVTPKPEGLCKRGKDEPILRRSEPRTSFLHKRNNGNMDTRQKPRAPEKQNSTEETLKSLPKPPVTIRGFDLVANLPTARPLDDSDEEDYEAFDERIAEEHRRSSMIRADSGLSLASARQNSVESVYRPPSSVNDEEQVYESITESPDENGQDFKKEPNSKNPPPLPANPPPNVAALQNYANKIDTKTERSLEKKSATLPHSGSNTSLSNLARPLPPPPDRQSYYERPWFHNLTREQANLLIEEQCTYGNSPDGHFLMRPSMSNPNNPLTLVLWCGDRVYNVPVRRRPDNRYALGTPKPEEQSFASIDDIVPYYKKEKLVLYTGGVKTGSTRLSDTPPK